MLDLAGIPAELNPIKRGSLGRVAAFSREGVGSSATKLGGSCSSGLGAPSLLGGVLKGDIRAPGAAEAGSGVSRPVSVCV